MVRQPRHDRSAAGRGFAAAVLVLVSGLSSGGCTFTCDIPPPLSGDATDDADGQAAEADEANADADRGEDGGDADRAEEGGEDPGIDDGADIDAREDARDAEVDGGEDARDAEAARCGDGTREGAEECDDGNDVAGDGCEADCTFSCHGAAECHETPADDPCTSDTCDAAGAGRACAHGPVAPPPPQPVAPLDGAVTGSFRLPPWAQALRPLFRWRQPDDGCGEPLGYAIDVGDVCVPGPFPDCTSVDGSSPSRVVRATDVTAREWRPAVDLEVETAFPPGPVGRRYFWRVRACRESECSAWASVRYVNVGMAPNDFNGDGYSDVVAGAPGGEDPVSGARAGVVDLYLGGEDFCAGIVSAPSSRLGDATLSAGSAFGAAVAFAGFLDPGRFGDLLVGAPRAGSGRVCAVFGHGDGPVPPPECFGEPRSPGRFGIALTGAGDVDDDGLADAVVGAPGEGGARGSVFVYRSSSGFDSLTKFEGPGVDDGFGSAVAAGGDVNGDGLADFVVGAPDAHVDGCGDQCGFVRLFLSDEADPLPSVADLAGEAAGGRFGFSAVLDGDFDGDGFPDLVLGAPHAAVEATESAGLAYVFQGSAAGLASTPSLVLASPAAGVSGRFGYSLAAGSSVDGDGLADLFVGAPYHALLPAIENGRVYEFAGDAPLDSTARVALAGADAGGRFGAAVAVAGDVNADGYADVVVGEPLYDDASGVSDLGRVLLYCGRPEAPLDAAPEQIWIGDGADWYYGASLGQGGAHGDLLP